MIIWDEIRVQTQVSLLCFAVGCAITVAGQLVLLAKVQSHTEVLIDVSATAPGENDDEEIDDSGASVEGGGAIPDGIPVVLGDSDADSDSATLLQRRDQPSGLGPSSAVFPASASIAVGPGLARGRQQGALRLPSPTSVAGTWSTFWLRSWLLGPPQTPTESTPVVAISAGASAIPSSG